MSNPTPLTGNSWGFALNNTTPGITTNNFDPTYNTPDPGKSSKWAGVPAKGNEVMFQSIPMNQTTTTTDVYYAVSAKDNLAEGTYTSSIVYTAIYEATDIPNGEMTLTPTSGTTGDVITLTTSAVPTMEDIGELENIIFIDPDNPSNTYNCLEPHTTKTSQGNIQATCKVPDMPNSKQYQVKATYNKTGETYLANERFDYSLPRPNPPSECDTYAPGITYMQDITDNTKADMVLEKQYFAVDRRDDKGYCISKLKDGNIWMTQNLDLDITTAGLTNADTDLNSVTAWNASSQYAPEATETTISNPITSMGTRSWSLGDYYYDGISLESCDSYADCSAFNTIGDQHYRVGNIYQYNAAIAGSAYSLGSQDGEAPDSICPKNWRLPTGNTNTNNEFQILMNAYSIQSDVQKVINAPLYYTRTGYITDRSIGIVRLSAAGHESSYWSSTGIDYGGGYLRGFGICAKGDADIRPECSADNQFGRGVRCIAR